MSLGKPVAVTHSKGKGASIDPNSDLGFEKREWGKKRSKGRKNQQPHGSSEASYYTGKLMFQSVCIFR